MFTYWFTGVSYWWPLALAIVFALAAVVAVYATLARRAEERDAGSIALLYAIGLGVVAVSEFMMYLDLAFGTSLATAWNMTTDAVSFVAIVAAMVAVVCLGAAATMQVREERDYRLLHPAH